MKFFIDTCNIDQIKEANSIGVLDGVTTNPSLAAKENAPYDDMLKEIAAVVKGPVSAEVVALDADFFVGGESLRYPGDPKGRADNVCNCHCNNWPVLKEV